tara:strand:- start:193 stop:447 length:255 start_codon:yes stop_codon:yes gene_type:complete
MTNYYENWNFDELNNQQLFGLFERSKSDLRKKKTFISELSVGMSKECLKRTFLELNRRDEMSFVDYQKVLKNLRTYENRYKEVA